MRLRPQVTRVQHNLTFRQRRQLAPGQSGVVTATLGQEVSFVQIVARSSQSAGLQVLDVEKEYGISPGDVAKNLLVRPGNDVRLGTPLIEHKRRFGRSRVIVSPFDGKIEDTFGGRVLIRRRPQEEEIRALLKGFVVFVIPHRGVTIETKATRIDGLFGSREEGSGHFKMLSGTPVEEAYRDDVLASVQGAILGLAVLSELDLVREAVTRGVRGFVVGSISEEIYRALGKLTVPLVVTDGIGRRGMARPIFETLAQSHGKEIALLAAHHSHHTRPLIAIPSDSGPNIPIQEHIPSLAPGMKVRVLRAPYESSVGEVVALYTNGAEPGYLGAHAPAALVRLLSGDEILVPCANLDINM